MPWKTTVADTLLTNLQETQTIRGRVLKPEIWVYSAPRFSSRKIGRLILNSVVDLKQTLTGDSDPFGDMIWFQIASSLYIHSSGVQPVEEQLNPNVSPIPSRGKLAQVTVPIAKAFKDSITKPKSFIHFFYGSNHWVTAIKRDEYGKSFFKIEEDRWRETYFVSAEDLHIISDEELTPISPSIPAQDKRLEVQLNSQTVTAYENEHAVFQSPMASGTKDENKDYSTPPGEYEISLKRPSRHMIHSDPFSDADADLYGVPWVCNFTNSGIAFHGTYWHNEFNHPHSHGCINLPIEAAKWIYLWSNPVVPPAERKFVSVHGTRVRVI